MKEDEVFIVAEYIFYSFKKNWGYILAQILIMCLAFYIMDNAWSQWDVKCYYTNTNRTLYAGSPECSYKVVSQMESGMDLSTLQEYGEIYAAFWEEMENLDSVKRFGVYSLENGALADSNEIGEVTGILTAGDMINMCRFELSEGASEPLTVWNGSSACPVLIGSELADIWNVGDYFEYILPYENIPVVCEVAGVFEKDSYWLAPYFVFSQKTLTELNRAIVMPCRPENASNMFMYHLMSSGNFIFECVDGKQDDVCRQTSQIMTELKFQASIQNVEELMAYMEGAVEEVYGPQKQLAVTVAVVLGIYTMITALTQFFNRKREFGIACVCGFSRRQLFVQQILQQGIMIAVALTAAVVLRFMECSLLVQSEEYGTQIVVLSHLSDTVPRIILTGGIVFAIPAVIIAIVWNKISTAELIRSGRRI